MFTSRFTPGFEFFSIYSDGHTLYKPKEWLYPFNYLKTVLLTPFRKEAKLIFRGPYSLGFAFVTFENAESAKKAVSTLKDMEVDNRKINVELATPQSDRGSPRRPSGGFRSFRGRRGGYFGGRGRFFGQRRPSRPRGTPSETVIYVGNLPFAVSDDDLKNYFSNYEIDNAHVVCYKSGRSKGYGFVTFKSLEHQQQALKEDIEVDKRKISLRAAYSEEPREAAAEQEGEEKAKTSI